MKKKVQVCIYLTVLNIIVQNNDTNCQEHYNYETISIRSTALSIGRSSDLESTCSKLSFPEKLVTTKLGSHLKQKSAEKNCHF